MHNQGEFTIYLMACKKLDTVFTNTKAQSSHTINQPQLWVIYYNAISYMQLDAYGLVCGSHTFKVIYIVHLNFFLM